MDRVLHSLMWLGVMGLIALTAGGSLFLSYSALLSLLNGDGPRALPGLLAGPALAGGCWILCRNSNDLMDR